MQVLESSVSSPRSDSEETESIIQILSTEGYAVNWCALHNFHVRRSQDKKVEPARRAWHRREAVNISRRLGERENKPWTWLDHCQQAREQNDGYVDPAALARRQTAGGSTEVPEAV
jgi:hypothetical protein